MDERPWFPPPKALRSYLDQFRPVPQDPNDDKEYSMTNEVQRWADAAMFRSEPMPSGANGPRVTLLNATPDPLGSLAALTAIYSGRVVRNLAELTDEERRKSFEDMTKTELSGPLEAPQFHFLIEGVTRAWTHQAVRQRGAFFAQESMRFAVPEEEWIGSGRIAYPPTLSGTEGGQALGAEDSTEEYMRNVWDQAVENVEQAYKHLVDAGMPAEDARGLMPHAITTRLHWVVDLRGLLHVAGLRLCTQAQFEWRAVMAQVVKALREYRFEPIREKGDPTGRDDWQYRHIADALRPVCYQKGSCGFMASMDRGCTIRERVDAFASVGVPSSEWHKNYDPENAYADGAPRVGQIGGPDFIRAIQPKEWLADPTAARRG